MPNLLKRRVITKHLKSDINVVPYIDVMMVLLVIFMVTAPLTTPSVVDLPKVASQSANQHLAIEIVIKKGQPLQLIDRDPKRSFEQPVLLKDVATAAQARMNVGEERPVVISADKTVVYESVMDVMDTLKRAGIARVGLSVRSSQ